MKKIIDLQTFQKITADCMRVHETVRSTEPLTAEAERILQLADSLLLREAGLAYLNEGQNLDLPSLPNSEQATPPEQVVENFIGVQHALADLKQALYQLVKTYAAGQRWPELETSINALIYLGEDVSEFSSLVEDTFIPQAEDLFKSEEWDKGRTLLRPWLFSPRVRSYYYTSYVDQADALHDIHPLVELRSQIPARLSVFEVDYSIRANSTDPLEHFKARGEVNKVVLDDDFKPRLVLSSDSPSR